MSAVRVILAGLALGVVGFAAEAQTGGTRTGKERLGDKWQDEQRVDNCGVPDALRGGRPRPDCADKPAPETPIRLQSAAPPAGGAGKEPIRSGTEPEAAK